MRIDKFQKKFMPIFVRIHAYLCPDSCLCSLSKIGMNFNEKYPLLEIYRQYFR